MEPNGCPDASQEAPSRSKHVTFNARRASRSRCPDRASRFASRSCVAPRKIAHRAPDDRSRAGWLAGSAGQLLSTWLCMQIAHHAQIAHRAQIAPHRADGSDRAARQLLISRIAANFPGHRASRSDRDPRSRQIAVLLAGRLRI